MDERLQALEAAMVKAHRAGDAQSARTLAAEIQRLRTLPETTKVMLEALKTTPPEQWESRMAGSGYPPETIAEVLQAAGVRTPSAEPSAAAAPDSSFTFARSQDPRNIPLGRDVSPEALVVAPPGTAGIPSFAQFEGQETPRDQGRRAALERDSGVGAAGQGFGSFMFGAGVPATAAAVMASRALPGGREPIGPGEALEYARGIREGSYESRPGAYRTGAAAGIAAGAGAVSAGMRTLPAAAQSVFSLQTGQTLRNLLRLSAAGAAAAGATAGAEQGVEAVPGAAAVGSAAGPLGAGVVRAGAAGVNAVRRMVSPTSAAIRILSQRLGEPAAALAARYNAFVETMGRAPRLIEIMRRETAEEIGEIGRQRFVGTGAAQVFRGAEEVAALARPAEMGRVIRSGGATSSVAAQDALAEPVIEETAETLARRAGGDPAAVNRSTEAAQIGRRDVQMDRVMNVIGDHEVPITDEMLAVLTHTDVWQAARPALRRGIAQSIEAGQAIGSLNLPVRMWEAIRQDLSSKAGAGAGQIYSQLRNRVRDYVSERVPEYGRALGEFGRRTDVVRGTATGTRALSMASRDLADAVRTAGGGTAGQAQRAGVRAAEQAGVRVGVRIALADALSGSPARARRYMERLARDPALRANLAEVLSDAEVGQLERLADRYGRRLDIRAGVAAGRRVGSRGTTESFQAAVDEAAASPAGAAGVRAGARGALADVAAESPAGAVTAAQRLARDPGLAQRIQTALGIPEAARLRNVGQTVSRAAENLSTVAPRATDAQMRAAAAAADINDITRSLIMRGKGSGAFEAGWVVSALQRAKMSKRAATRLAEMVADPDPTGRAQAGVIAMLRNQYGLSPETIAQIYRSAAITAGIISQ